MNVKFKTHLFILSLFFCYNLSAQEIVKGDFKNENPQSSYVPSFDMDATDKPVKNVILMIGDGMGLAQTAWDWHISVQECMPIKDSLLSLI